MIRDIPPDERNPYTVDQTERMIYAAFESYGDEVSIITIPDIESINWGRGVGYETNEHPAAPLHVSGTEIRSRIAAGESISEFVCPAVEKVLREIS
jgi:nicotinamide mononucleotide adenylyltransferase